MDGSKCICLIRGVRPFLSRKYDITQHTRYKYLSDYDKKNAFDIMKYLSQLRKPRPSVAIDESFDFHEIEDEAIETIEISDADVIGEIDDETEI